MEKSLGGQIFNCACSFYFAINQYFPEYKKDIFLS